MPAAVLTDPGGAKAATLAPGGDMAFFSFPIEKVEDGSDGDVIVWGKATDGSLDSDLQVVDPDWSQKALAEWFATGANVRVQHQAQRDPAGKGIEVSGHHVRARIVEPVAVKLVKAGVLQDFSVGIMNPEIRRGDPRFRHLDPHGKAVNGVITGREDGASKIGEVSIVDRGSNFGTKFALVKAAADGSPEWVGQLSAPDDVLAKVAAPKARKTVTVELPKSMSISVKPSDLAKLATFKRKLAAGEAATVAKDAVPDVPILPVTVDEPAPDAAKAAVFDAGLEAIKAVGAAEDMALGKGSRTFTAEQRREHASAGVSLADGSYPMPDADAVRRAAVLIRSKHGNWKAAAKLLARRARALGIANPLKTKIAAPAAVKGKGKLGECPTCKGRGYVKSGNVKCGACGGSGKATGKTVVPDEGKKKSKVMCGHCGARQNAKHVHCPECGGALAPGSIPVTKNHDFTCLGCGKTPLDKGEQHCPECGRENPGYLPEADRKIPANMDAGKSAAKERVGTDTAVAKGKKKAGKKKPFGGNQAKPFGGKDEPDADDKPKAEKRRKGGKKKGGKGRSPAVGAVAQSTEGVPDHRDGGPALGDLKDDAALGKNADMETGAAMRLKSVGCGPELGALHDLTCPAFTPADVTAALPHAAFAAIDTESWQRKALDAASGASMPAALDAWNAAAELSRHAVTLKTADPQVLHDLRLEANAAFAAVNESILKTFRDAMPGPGSFPNPAHPMPGQFRRPYLSAGHAAPSPGHEGARSFPVTTGSPAAVDYQRDYLTAGHAADSPGNDTPRRMPQPASSEAGKPGRVFYANTMRDNARQALNAMHDHISHLFPDICPMSPHMGDTQKPAPPVAAGVGGPVPHGASKSAKPGAKLAKAKARKAAKVKAKNLAAKRRKLERRVLKGALTIGDARAKLGLKPFAAPGTAVKAAGTTPEPMSQPVDAQAVTAAVKAATKPLAKRLARQDKALRKNAKVLDAIASQPDTSAAPFRGAGVAKQASAAPAGPLTAAESAERAQAGHLQRLHHEWRNSYDPGQREAAWRELTAQLGIDPVTQNNNNIGTTPIRVRT